MSGGQPREQTPEEDRLCDNPKCGWKTTAVRDPGLGPTSSATLGDDPADYAWLGGPNIAKAVQFMEKQNRKGDTWWRQ